MGGSAGPIDGANKSGTVRLMGTPRVEVESSNVKSERGSLTKMKVRERKESSAQDRTCNALIGYLESSPRGMVKSRYRSGFYTGIVQNEPDWLVPAHRYKVDSEQDIKYVWGWAGSEAARAERTNVNMSCGISTAEMTEPHDGIPIDL
jgi:hypothetical protein